MADSLTTIDAVAVAQSHSIWVIAAFGLGLLVGWSARRQYGQTDSR